jgi:hypothetical protein
LIEDAIADREFLAQLVLFGRHPARASTAASVIVSSLDARKCARGRLEPLAEDAVPLAGGTTTPQSGVRRAPMRPGRRTVGTATMMIDPQHRGLRLVQIWTISKSGMELASW